LASGTCSFFFSYSLGFSFDQIEPRAPPLVRFLSTPALASLRGRLVSHARTYAPMCVKSLDGRTDGWTGSLQYRVVQCERCNS
jgi:hypothetical protein